MADGARVIDGRLQNDWSSLVFPLSASLPLEFFFAQLAYKYVQWSVEISFSQAQQVLSIN